jgi:hypothetical protein
MEARRQRAGLSERLDVREEEFSAFKWRASF